MEDVEGALPPRPRIPRPFLIALALLTLVSFGLGLRRANRSTLRGDEVMAHFDAIRGQPLGDLLLHGPRGQASPAPLLYVADKVMDALKAPLRYLGLTPPGYFRLPSLLFTAALGFAAAMVVATRIRGGAPIRFLLILCGLAAYAFHPKVFAFAGTERPYGLWNGLWLLALAWQLGRPPLPKVLLILFSVLAATATASCFQILAVGVALLIVRRIERRPAKEILKEGALLLALPAIIAAYYALQTDDMGYEARAALDVTPNFLRFWLLSNLHVWIAAGAMTALALARPALRPLAIPPLALAALLLLMPLMFLLAHLRGNSMVSRQYIWTSTAVPLALFFAAVAWTELRPTRFLRVVAVVAALGIAGGNIVATFSRPALRNDSRELALTKQDSPLMTLLRSESPAAVVYTDKLGDIELRNLLLLVDWIRIRSATLPAGNERIWILEQEGRLEALLLGDRWPGDAGGMVSIPVR